MTQQFDEFSKSLALTDSIPRRESLRRFGAVLAGAVLAPLGFGTASGAGSDPCKAFCRCSNKKQQNACLSACRACGNNTSRLCGGCGSYVCCANGKACCAGYCADLANDDLNCGACGYACPQPGPYEDGACFDGGCVYACVEGALDCDGICTPVLRDPDNCGACGNVCPESTPYCEQGACTAQAPCPSGLTRCSGVCRDLYNDPSSCGTSCENAVVCGLYEFCTGGVCEPAYEWWVE
jgi:hypothetical protein